MPFGQARFIGLQFPHDDSITALSPGGAIEIEKSVAPPGLEIEAIEERAHSQFAIIILGALER